MQIPEVVVLDQRLYLVILQSARSEKVCVWMCVLVTQSYPTLCDPTDCSPQGSSVRGILQARILEWVAIPFSRGSPDPGMEPRSSALHTGSLLSELMGHC